MKDNKMFTFSLKTPFFSIDETLSEDIEELRSEKVMLPRSLDCADDAAMGDLKKDIAAMEAALKKLDEHEEDPRSVRERLRNLQQEQSASPRKKERDQDR